MLEVPRPRALTAEEGQSHPGEWRLPHFLLPTPTTEDAGGPRRGLGEARTDPVLPIVGSLDMGQTQNGGMDG